jgi:hypothetical protein
MSVRSALSAAVAVIALTGAATIAQANPVTGTFGIAVYQFNCAGCDINSANEQAVITNTAINVGNFKGSGNYTGAINFIDNGSGNGNIGTFLASAGGSNTLSGAVTALALSSSNFNLTTIMVITGNAPLPLNGNISHDDGATLYSGQLPGALAAVTPPGSEKPTVDVPSPYILPAGLWTLVYVEANGLPADLVFDSVINFDQTTPLPAALPLFAGGLGVLGLLSRRKKRKVAVA